MQLGLSWVEPAIMQQRLVQLVVQLFLQQLLVSRQELDAIVARLNTRPVKEVKVGSESSQAKAVRLSYAKDAAKGFKEVYTPVKRVCLYITNHTKLVCTSEVYGMPQPNRSVLEGDQPA